MLLLGIILKIIVIAFYYFISSKSIKIKEKCSIVFLYYSIYIIITVNN